jgi:hypothetical protein
MTFEPQTFQLLASNALADPPAPERGFKTWALEPEPVLARDRANYTQSHAYDFT